MTTPRVQLCSPVSSSNSSVTTSWQNIINSPPPIQEQQLHHTAQTSIAQSTAAPQAVQNHSSQVLLQPQQASNLQSQSHPSQIQPTHQQIQPPPKPKKKKSKKKKKDEEPKLDLANIMKLSGKILPQTKLKGWHYNLMSTCLIETFCFEGIGDEDDIGPYEHEDPTVIGGMGVGGGLEANTISTQASCAPAGLVPAAQSPPPEPLNLQVLALKVSNLIFMTLFGITLF